MPDTDTYWGCIYCGADLTHENHRNTCPNCDEPLRGRLINPEREAAEASRKDDPKPPVRKRAKHTDLVHVTVLHRPTGTKVPDPKVTGEEPIGIDRKKWEKARRGNQGSQNSIMVYQVLPRLKEANSKLSSAFWNDCDFKVVDK